MLQVIDTDSIRETHFNINFWTDEEVLAWKASYLQGCNAISVAGAIFASLGLASLQIPDINSTHWSARACLVASMVLGILSVKTATSQQQAVGMLNSPLTIRLWLSRGAGDAMKHRENQPFNILPLESSVASVKATSYPRHLLQLAVWIFLLGFGLYCLFAWLDNPGGRSSDYRNIFIVFIITLCLSRGYKMFWKAVQTQDARKASLDFDLRSRGSYETPYYLEKLKRDLKRVQDLAAEMEREEMRKYATAHGLSVEAILEDLDKQGLGAGAAFNDRDRDGKRRSFDLA